MQEKLREAWASSRKFDSQWTAHRHPLQPLEGCKGHTHKGHRDKVLKVVNFSDFQGVFRYFQGVSRYFSVFCKCFSLCPFRVCPLDPSKLHHCTHAFSTLPNPSPTPSPTLPQPLPTPLSNTSPPKPKYTKPV